MHAVTTVLCRHKVEKVFLMMVTWSLEWSLLDWSTCKHLCGVYGHLELSL